jgi:glycosyltransferase involved in cell wall biosynthesis
MKIVVCSMFRDSQVWCGKEINQVDRYFSQLLKQSCGFKGLNILALEGNSTDNTYAKLQEYASIYPNINVMQEQNTFHTVVSNEDPRRITGLSKVADTLLDTVSKIEGLDYILWLESDLIIDMSLIKDLLFATRYTQDDCIIAPMVFIEKRGAFYDTWGFRELDDQRWDSGHRERVALANPLKEMSSVGSCALISANLIKCGARFGDGAFVELCRRSRELGGKVYVDVNTKIHHPGTKLLNGRWV